MRKREAIGCSCAACKRGKHGGGHFIIAATNRRLRRLYRLALKVKEDPDQIVISTPYTD